MPYQNNLATLADIVSPAYAAQQVGIENDMANQEAMAKAQVASATAPAEIQKSYLNNLLTAAQTANTQGLAQQNQAEGQVAQALVPDKISSGQALAQSKVTAAHVEQIQSLGQIVGGISDQMRSVPAPARPAMMQQILNHYGVQDPAMRQLVGSGDPDQLRQLSAGLFQASNEARKTMLSENMRGQYAENVADINANSRQLMNDRNAQARLEVAKVNQQAKQMQQGFEQAATLEYNTNGDTPKYREMAQRALDAKQFSAQTNRALLGLGDISGAGVEPPREAAPTKPTPSKQSPAPQAVEAAAKQAFGSYEPDKYEYGINPNTGNFGRRPKQ